MMIDLALGTVAGFVLGALHMWMLWRASMRLREKTGARALLGGAVLRLAVVLVGFVAVAGSAAHPGLALSVALCGFALIRNVALQRVQSGAMRRVQVGASPRARGGANGDQP